MSVLAEIKPRSQVLINEINGDSFSKRRLAQMGMRKNKTLVVLENVGKGPILVEIDHSKLVIGRKLAEKIIVRQVTPNKAR